jgi:succinate dehydrogenase / fumarate reductase, membrane anchor subunit
MGICAPKGCDMSISFPSKPNAANTGTNHWWWQRVTAICLIPLSIWFVVSVLGHINDDHAAASNWIKSIPVTVLLLSFMVTVFYHAKFGLQVIAEDYVHDPSTLKTILFFINASMILAGLASVSAIVVISFIIP